MMIINIPVVFSNSYKYKLPDPVVQSQSGMSETCTVTLKADYNQLKQTASS